MLGWAGGQPGGSQEYWKACLAVNETYLCCSTVLGLLPLARTAACKQVLLLWLKGSAEWWQPTKGRHQLSEMQDPKFTWYSGTSAHPVVSCSIARSSNKTNKFFFLFLPLQDQLEPKCSTVCLVLLLNKINAFNFSRMEILKTIPLHFANHPHPLLHFKFCQPFFAWAGSFAKPCSIFSVSLVQATGILELYLPPYATLSN